MRRFLIGGSRNWTKSIRRNQKWLLLHTTERNAFTGSRMKSFSRTRNSWMQSMQTVLQAERRTSKENEVVKKDRIILGMRNRVGTSRRLKYTKCGNRKMML